LARAGLAAVLLASGQSAFAGGQKGDGHAPARPPGHPGDTQTATDGAANTPIDEFERMSPEQQQQALARLPEAQRKRLEQRLRQFNLLPFEQRQMLRNLYSRLHQLPPRQQETVHKAIDRFSKQPGDSQQVLRDELRLLSALPEQDRVARVASQDFRQGLTRKELGILRDMLPLLPLSTN
jgi:Protein of unknown function (DUF3106)